MRFSGAVAEVTLGFGMDNELTMNVSVSSRALQAGYSRKVPHHLVLHPTGYLFIVYQIFLLP